MSHRRASASTGRDRGAALVMVLVWGVGLLLLALVMSTAVTRLVRPSDDAEQSFRAWTAAEAGIDDFRARVAAAKNGDMTASLDPATNPALAGWIPIPGVDPAAAGDTRFRYTLDTSRMSSAGRIVITSTGYAGGQFRTVRAELAKSMMFDYAYASAYETIAPRYPDYYKGSSLFDRAEPDRAEAELYCGDRYWYESGPLPPPAAYLPNHRDSTACVGGLIANWALGQNDRFIGRVHTNDVFVLSSTSANLPDFSTGTVFPSGPPASSCPPGQSGVSVGCPDAHRWIAGNVVDGSGYVVDETQGPVVEAFKPPYEEPIEIRAEGRGTLRERAEEAGCVFTGPTRLRFHADGTLVVTSPDSRSANPSTPGIQCGGTTLVSANPRTPRPVALTPADLGPNFNGIIYVQDVPSGGDANAWSTTPPSCQDKVPSTTTFDPFPFVVTASSVTGSNGVSYADNNGFSSTQTLYGFPSEGTKWTASKRETFSTDLDQASVAQQCRTGTAYLEGVYSGRWTVVAEGDIALTSDVVDAAVPSGLRPNRVTTPGPSRNPPAGWGTPPATSASVMGLVPDRMLYVYGCSSELGCGAWDRARMTTNLVLNVATVVVDGCLTVMDSTLTTDYGRLTIVGSLGQKYRCPIAKPSGLSGFGLYVAYDSRFATGEPPPYLAELSQEPWHVESVQEIRTPAELGSPDEG